MGYQPIHDGTFDVAISDDDGLRELLDSIFKHKLVLVDWKSVGPGGGNPMVTIRGTRRQHVAWLNDYYDPDQEVVGPTNDPRPENDRHLPLDDDQVWHAHQEMGTFKFVA